jgi:hypothetical protein
MSISQKIINSVAAEMVGNTQTMGQIAIVPNTFDVHIHTDDFRTVRHFLKELREQTVKRLDEEVNRRSNSDAKQGLLASVLKRVLGFEALAGRKEYRRVEEHWDVNFHECNGKVRVEDKVFELRKGEVCTVSTFSSSHSQSLGSEFGTFVTVYQEDDSTRSPLTDQSQIDQNLIPTLPMSQMRGEDGPPPASYFATLKYKYKDSSEWHAYRMAKDKITIGRPSRDGAVDLPLARASDRISPAHLEIRADGGRFFLRSMGAFGTTINGSRVPDASEGGEVELPDGARITLAGGEVRIDFSKAERR